MRRPLVISTHAQQRMKENTISVAMLERMWKLAREVKVPIYRKRYKKEKYGKNQDGVRYFWHSGYLLTIDTHKMVLVTIAKESLSSVILR
ncbi:hypothetical protein KKB83_04275 [Patescibacteria group bacterium]|nr:hypothetical protein [Patescibacteria group bacterium]